MVDNPSLLVQASQAAEDGDKPTARKLLDELIFFEPGNEEAWLLLSKVVDDRNEVADCFQHILEINPHNQSARQEYNELLGCHPELVKLDRDKTRQPEKETGSQKKLYDRAYHAYWNGDKNKAESLLSELVVQFPEYEPGWYLLSLASTDPQLVEKCLRQVLEIMPENQSARTRLKKFLEEKKI